MANHQWPLRTCRCKITTKKIHFCMVCNNCTMNELVCESDKKNCFKQIWLAPIRAEQQIRTNNFDSNQTDSTHNKRTKFFSQVKICWQIQDKKALTQVSILCAIPPRPNPPTECRPSSRSCSLTMARWWPPLHRILPTACNIPAASLVWYSITNWWLHRRQQSQ